MKSDSMPHIASHTCTTIDASFMDNVHTTGLLNDIFWDLYEGNVENNYANTWDFGNPMHRVDDEFIDELRCNAVMNNGENFEDAGYRKLIDEAEQALYLGSNYSSYSFFWTYSI